MTIISLSVTQGVPKKFQTEISFEIFDLGNQFR